MDPAVVARQSTVFDHFVIKLELNSKSGVYSAGWARQNWLDFRP